MSEGLNPDDGSRCLGPRSYTENTHGDCHMTLDVTLDGTNDVTLDATLDTVTLDVTWDSDPIAYQKDPGSLALGPAF